MGRLGIYGKKGLKDLLDYKYRGILNFFISRKEPNRLTCTFCVEGDLRVSLKFNRPIEALTHAIWKCYT